MKITIAARYRPFSHELGASCLLPRTCWLLEAFPALLRLRSLESAGWEECIEIPLNVQGPVREFTLEQDLEKGWVTVWGKAVNGRFRLKLQATRDALVLSLEKGIKAIEETLRLPLTGPYCEGPARERLSLGSHKALDWEQVKRRFDLCDILPPLYHLSQWIPKLPQRPAMLELLREGFEPFLRAAFFQILCPRLVDDQHQGIFEAGTVAEGDSPLALITGAATRIRELFIEEKGRLIALRTPFESGRFTGLSTESGVLDLEWSKGAMRRAVLSASNAGEISFDLQKPLRSYRLRSHVQEKGRRVESREIWSCEKNQLYFLDRFQK